VQKEPLHRTASKKTPTGEQVGPAWRKVKEGTKKRGRKIPVIAEKQSKRDKINR